MSDLSALHEVQARDTALDVLVHRRATLSERAELDRTLLAGKAAHEELVTLRERRDQLTRTVKALDDETQTAAAKVQAVNDKLYSGKVTSPRELQDLQADLDQLRRHLGEIEERELDQMVAAEELAEAVLAAEHGLAALGARVEQLRAAISAAEVEIDAEHSAVSEARASLATGIPEALLADYERRRKLNKGVGAALLIGDTCQGCRLSIPATEVDEIRRDDTGRIFGCDNCGAILVAR